MSDIFDEVGEDLRRERMKKLWQGYSVYIIGAAVLVVLATAGWQIYGTWSAKRAAEAGDAYRAAIAAAAEGDHKAAAEALAAFTSGAPEDYALLARMRAATEHAAAGETDTALATFEAIANDAGTPAAIRDLATLRAAMIAVDRESPSQVKARVAPLDTPDGPYRHAARELVAVAALKAEDYAAAREALAALTGDPNLPADFRQRANVMEEIVRGAIGDAPAAGAGS